MCAKADFSPKTWEERTIEIPIELVNILKELPRKAAWVFANGARNRDTHMWDDAKVTGKKAKIADCHPHKFRSTFATRLLHGESLQDRPLGPHDPPAGDQSGVMTFFPGVSSFRFHFRSYK